MNAIEIYENAIRMFEINGEITLGEFEEMIKPLEDVAPVVHGEWVKITDVDIRLMGRQIKEVHYKCSVCGGESYFDTNYCSHCGAKMEVMGE